MVAMVHKIEGGEYLTISKPFELLKFSTSQNERGEDRTFARIVARVSFTGQHKLHRAARVVHNAIEKIEMRGWPSAV